MANISLDTALFHLRRATEILKDSRMELQEGNVLERLAILEAETESVSERLAELIGEFVKGKA